MATILVVDDSSSIRKMVEFALRTQGHQITPASDGQEALETLERGQPGPFDLMVLDVNMPRLDGLSLLQAVRARPEWSAVRVLMLTTEDLPADRDRALALGANAYMSKPFKPSDLIAQVAALLATG